MHVAHSTATLSNCPAVGVRLHTPRHGVVSITPVATAFKKFQRVRGAVLQTLYTATRYLVGPSTSVCTAAEDRMQFEEKTTAVHDLRNSVVRCTMRPSASTRVGHKEKAGFLKPSSLLLMTTSHNIYSGLPAVSCKTRCGRYLYGLRMWFGSKTFFRRPISSTTSAGFEYLHPSPSPPLHQSFVCASSTYASAAVAAMRRMPRQDRLCYPSLLSGCLPEPTHVTVPRASKLPIGLCSPRESWELRYGVEAAALNRAFNSTSVKVAASLSKSLQSWVHACRLLKDPPVHLRLVLCLQPPPFCQLRRLRNPPSWMSTPGPSRATVSQPFQGVR